MDTIRADEARLRAGAEYLSALRSLGFEPDGLFWAWDKQDEVFVLLLVSAFYDVAGPLSLSKLLFKAYNASITPKEIDPFIVRLHSPLQTYIRSIHDEMFLKRVTVREWDDDIGGLGKPYLVQDKAVVSTVNDVYQVVLNDIYYLKERKQKLDAVERKWRLVNRNLDALAA